MTACQHNGTDRKSDRHEDTHVWFLTYLAKVSLSKAIAQIVSEPLSLNNGCHPCARMRLLVCPSRFTSDVYAGILPRLDRVFCRAPY